MHPRHSTKLATYPSANFDGNRKRMTAMLSELFSVKLTRSCMNVMYSLSTGSAFLARVAVTRSRCETSRY